MSKVTDSIIGHAIGDAMGVPTEFRSRESLMANPVTEMINHSKLPLPMGCWSDDTSMLIATIDSYNNNECFDYNDIMYKWYEWLRQGKYTATGGAFDIGTTCYKALSNYAIKHITPLKCGINDINNGNGSLMRILPVALYCYYKNLKEEEIISLTNNLSSLTHSHDISKMGCYIYVRYVMKLLEGYNKIDAYNFIKELNYNNYDINIINKYNRILKNNIYNYDLNDISSLGYVIPTLESSLWILLNNNTFKDTIITSTNIGNDTDTIGAITGSMAGIIYGLDSIPKEWLDKLLRKDYLIDLSKNFEKKLIK